MVTEKLTSRLLIDIPYVMPSSHESQRLFHGRGHAYPNYEHVLIDWLSPVVLITLYKPAEKEDLHTLAKALFSAITDCHSVQVQYRYEQQAPIECLEGVNDDLVIAEENQLKYQVTLGRAQNTGLFLDMKNGRQWVKEHAANARVLNLFSYTCAFSVAAVEGGAQSVYNIDMSRKSLATGRDNHRLNEHDLNKVKFDAIDIFKSFGRIKKHGPYDLLICDPPSFQKGSVDIKRDYKKIIRRLPDFMSPNGKVMLCLNSPDLDAAFLKETVKQACSECVYLGELTPPKEFTEAMEGKGLKILIYQYEKLD